MDDILSMPWTSAEGWHLATYFLNCEVGNRDHPYMKSPFSDGDREECTEDELPTHEESIDAWRDYFLWAAESGEDPLEEFLDVWLEIRDDTWKDAIRECAAKALLELGG